MSNEPTDNLRIQDFYVLEKSLVDEISRGLPQHEGQLHTDLSILSIVVETLAGMLGGYIVSNIPVWKDLKGRLNREQILQVEEALQNALLRSSLLDRRQELVQKVEGMLPGDTRNRQEVASRVVEQVFSHLGPADRK